MDTSAYETWEPTGETSKTYGERWRSGFITRYLGGPVVLDIGFRGGSQEEARAVTPRAIGVDLDYRATTAGRSRGRTAQSTPSSRAMI